MPKSMNEVRLLGNLGKDPEIRTTPKGGNVATLNLATTESYKDQSGQWQETTDWHRVVMWNNNADTCQKYLSKGSKVMIDGKLKTRSYEDKQGNQKYITEVIGSKLYLLDNNKGEHNQTADYKEDYNQTKENDDDVPF